METDNNCLSNILLQKPKSLADCHVPYLETKHQTLNVPIEIEGENILIDKLINGEVSVF